MCPTQQCTETDTSTEDEEELNTPEHFRFIMCPTQQCMMKTIHQNLNIIHLMKSL